MILEFIAHDISKEMGMQSSRLNSEAKKYAKEAKDLNLQFLYRKYGPPAIVVLIVVFVLYVYSRW